MLYSQLMGPCLMVEGAVAAHVLSQSISCGCNGPGQGPTFGSAVGHTTGLITSCGTVSTLQLKSPVRHSPKAIVFDVPSVMSVIEIGGVWLPLLATATLIAQVGL